MRRHGITDAGDDGAVHFGMALWPYDVLLRFAYDLPEHEHRWEGRWFDDRFEAAALDMRASASKLLIALRRMDGACSRLTAATADPVRLTELRAAAEAAPIEIDLVVVYLRRVVDGLAAIVPCCFGSEGRAMAGHRTSFASLVDSEALRKCDEEVANLLHPPDAVARVLARTFATHPAELYAVSAAAGDAPALPRAAVAAMTEAAAVILDAAETASTAMRDACSWLDAVLDRLIAVVCERAEDGPELLERWSETDWTVLRTSVPPSTLTAHLPAG